MARKKYEIISTCVRRVSERNIQKREMNAAGSGGEMCCAVRGEFIE